jgi:hypothetical protein
VPVAGLTLSGPAFVKGVSCRQPCTASCGLNVVIYCNGLYDTHHPCDTHHLCSQAVAERGLRLKGSDTMELEIILPRDTALAACHFSRARHATLRWREAVDCRVVATVGSDHAVDQVCRLQGIR